MSPKVGERARKHNTSHQYFVICLNGLSTTKVVVYPILLAINSYELKFDSVDIAVKISVCIMQTWFLQRMLMAGKSAASYVRTVFMHVIPMTQNW